MACDDLILPLLEELRTCAASQFGRCRRPVCRFDLYFSDHPAPADGCDCTCEPDGQGVAWIRLVAIEPDPSPVPSPCAGGSTTAVVEIGVHRCAPTTENPDQPWVPGMYDDVHALRRTPLCCTALEDTRWQVQTVQPIGPSGGCVGAAIQLGIRLIDCGCPEEAAL
ncbi:hypothetical protein FB384_004868 [Prauserella sediminis]|uniref:Uncharacterized protein n=1 Tax=Prauserella sediminis TaxID=577680 RepID=A0A839XV34_9PSEU|nr:hypothetical protein [Prauserella sediminis]MBB3665909.1 hypothetical protein [Prauserella sediminis]